MESTSWVTNYDQFIHETSKGVASIGNVQDIDQARAEPFVGHSGRIRERLENEATLTWVQVWWLVPVSMWVQLYTSVEFESLKSLGVEPFGCSYFLYPW
jgi:hypothetical protein